MSNRECVRQRRSHKLRRTCVIPLLVVDKHSKRAGLAGCALCVGGWEDEVSVTFLAVIDSLCDAYEVYKAG